ncbi:MAG TPA: hypothetical protein PLG66_19525, partial [Calditrichia bacterium]|nr:hypothetical protein [Calditrichia bacterium]
MSKHTPGFHPTPVYLNLLKVAGLVLFLIGLGLFTFSNFQDQFRITPEIAEQLSAHIPDAEIRQRLSPVVNQTFDNKFILIDNINRLLNPDHSIQDYQ